MAKRLIDKVAKADGIHYNRKFNRWELWVGYQMIYFYNIGENEDHIESYKAVVKQATNLYGYDAVHLPTKPDPVPVKKLVSKEFKGNVLVTVSEHEVRIWVCNYKGENIFRFKALGEVRQGGNDIVVFANKHMED